MPDAARVRETEAVENVTEAQIFAMLQKGIERMGEELHAMRGQLTELTTSQVQLMTRFEAMSSLGKRVGEVEHELHEQELELKNLSARLDVAIVQRKAMRNEFSLEIKNLSDDYEKDLESLKKELRVYRWVGAVLGAAVLIYVFNVAMQIPQ